jgi:hypothetical protein
MQSGIRYSSFLLVITFLLGLGTSVLAQQIRFEDFSDPTDPRYLHINCSQDCGASLPGTPPVLRLTDGSSNLEASTVYFQDTVHALGIGKQPVAGGFTTWFTFQIHGLQCCAPGDGISFIIQNSSATDPTMCASGFGFTALGAGGNLNCPAQAGALGYAGINNSLVIEFDVVQDAWDPSSNHIAIQTCGPNINTPVHDPGTYQIGNNMNVQSCLLNQSQQSIDSNIAALGGSCNGESCMDGIVHNVVIGYTPPSGNQQLGTLQVWLDPTFFPGTHDPMGPPTMSVPYNIVYDQNNNPSGLILDPANGGSAWVGFTASQPADAGEIQDIMGWEFTLHSPVQVSEVIQPGGQPTDFSFGGHQTTVTYPPGFSNPNNIVMTVTATPTDRVQFYQTRLAGTQFSNEQCIVYLGTGGGNGQLASGNCIVYSYTCQDQNGNQVTCPSETDPTIVIDTTFYTRDNVTPTNADYLENDAIGDNNWMSIFTSYMNAPKDGTTTGKSNGFGGGGSGRRSPVKSRIHAGQVGSADIVATFNPSQP